MGDTSKDETRLVDRSDMTVAIRNFFANRNPLVARLPWAPGHQAAREFRVAIWRADAGSSIAGVLPGGVASPFGFYETMGLQNMVDDAEMAIYCELRSILEASRIRREYTGAPPLAFFEEAIGLAKRGGGEPDLMLISLDCAMSPELMLRRVEAGETALGTPIRCLESAAIPGVTVVECVLLRPATAVALTSEEVRIRTGDVPRYVERPGGAGEWASAFGIDVRNGRHHSWAEATIRRA